MAEKTPLKKYQEYIENKDVDSDNVVQTMFQGDQVEQRFLKWDVSKAQEEVDPSQKKKNQSIKSPKRRHIQKNKSIPAKKIDFIYPLFVDEHWALFKEVLDFYYPPEDSRKYYIGIRSISSYMNSPKATIVIGEYSERLIKAIFKIHPKEFTLTYSGVNNRDLIIKNWDTIKVAYFVFFEENMNLIYRRYMRNLKHFNVRIKCDTFKIPVVAVLTSTSRNSLPSNSPSNTNVIELSNYKTHLEELARFESYKQGRKYEYNRLTGPIKKHIKKLQVHFRDLDCLFLVEISFDDLLREEFILDEDTISFKEFLDLIKYITFFHQNHREWYQDKKSGKKYLLAHPNDFMYGYLIAIHIFTIPSQNLTPAKLKFFNYLVKMGDKKIEQDQELKDLTLYDIQLEQSKIINEYPGKKSTLLLWLSEFSSTLRLLTRSQKMKNAKVYYSINRIAPLKANRFESLIKNVKKAYQDRVAALKELELKDSKPIVFHQLEIPNKNGEK